jgi:Phosphotransferase enzyme family
LSGDDFASRAARLSGRKVDRVEPVLGGGNNRLFRVTSGDLTFALKVYAGNATESRERYAREFTGLTFLWGRGERRIPEPLALDAESQTALYAWLAGEPGGTASDADLAAICDFARALFDAREDSAAANLADAREAVLSATMLSEQLASRLARLRQAEGEHPELRPLLADLARVAARRIPEGMTERPLPRSNQTLSPSDFGTHNAVRTSNGLAFIDFEYFGWDDPVKLVADVLWHPGMALAPAARQKFFAAAADVYKVDPGFLSRFERDAPLYGLRWALIVLGEFLPEVWQRRLAAGAGGDAPAARARQLAKAADLVERALSGAVVA